MALREVKLQDLDTEDFVQEKVNQLVTTVGEGLAMNALSGGVDSSVVTMLGHRALGKRLKSYFIDSGLMREGEPQEVVDIFSDLGVEVQIVDARDRFFEALKGKEDPEEKREAVTRTFYAVVFSELAKKDNVRYVLQGTNYTDVEETLAGVKRQHNIIEQLGIRPEKEYGYQIVEPLLELRKPAIRAVGRFLGLPPEIYRRPPFPGPALAARVIGEVTRGKTELVRASTKIVEEILRNTEAFQFLAVLHQDRVTGMREGKRDYGFQIEVRCWDSADAVTATPTRLPYDMLEKIAERLTAEVSGVVSVTYNIAHKPPSTIEAV